jgi:hypothetical protein
MERAAAIEDTAAGVLTEAARTGATPERVARTRAQTRVRVEGARHRWRPGDPTAWTHGEPLRRLRPLRRAG